MRPGASATVGILKTLIPKCANDSAGGSLPRRELPTGLRDGGGIFASETSGGQAIRCQTVQPAARLSANLRLLRRTRLCEADPSPGLWPPPCSKGGRFPSEVGQGLRTAVGLAEGPEGPEISLRRFPICAPPPLRRQPPDDSPSYQLLAIS